jgi:hypothetical protein
MEKQLLALSPPETLGAGCDRQTARLLEAACSLLADAQQSAVAIELTVNADGDGAEAACIWAYGKRLARQHSLRANACLRGHNLTVCFRRQKG